MDQPFLRLHSVNRADMATDAAHALIREGGTGALSVRSVAARMDMTPQGVLHIFGSREQMLTAVARCYASRWDAWLGRSVHWSGVPGALPQEQVELEGAAVWLALCSLARSVAPVANPVAWVNAREGDALRRAVADGPLRERLTAEHAGRPEPFRGPAPEEAQLDVLQAALHGLRNAVTDPGEPMSLERAHVALQQLVPRPGQASASNTVSPSTHVETT